MSTVNAIYGKSRVVYLALELNSEATQDDTETGDKSG